MREVLLQRALEGVEREEQREIVKAMEDAERERRVREEQDAVRDAREEQIRNRGDVQAVVEAERERRIGMYMVAQAEIQAAKERQHKLQVAGALLGRDLDSNVSIGHVASRQALFSVALAASESQADGKPSNVDGGKIAANLRVTVDVGGIPAGPSDKTLPSSSAEAETPTPQTSASDFTGMWDDADTMPVTSFSYRYRSRIPPAVDEIATPMSSYTVDPMSSYSAPMSSYTVDSSACGRPIVCPMMPCTCSRHPTLTLSLSRHLHPRNSEGFRSGTTMVVHA